MGGRSGLAGSSVGPGRPLERAFGDHRGEGNHQSVRPAQHAARNAGVALLERDAGTQVLLRSQRARRFDDAQLDRLDVLHVLVAVLRRADQPQRCAVSGVEWFAVQRPGEEYVVGEQVVGPEHGPVPVGRAHDGEALGGQLAVACPPPGREWHPGPRLAASGPGGDAVEVGRSRAHEIDGAQFVERDAHLAEGR